MDFGTIKAPKSLNNEYLGPQGNEMKSELGFRV